MLFTQMDAKVFIGGGAPKGELLQAGAFPSHPLLMEEETLYLLQRSGRTEAGVWVPPLRSVAR